MSTDLERNKDEKSVRVVALDGLRALGVFVIVAGHLHAFGYTAGQELWGNYIFFMLSGFVSVEPWNLNTEEKFLSLSFVSQFYVKRFMHVMPAMLYVTLLQALIEQGTNVFNNLLFVNPYYIGWFIKNIVIYYLVFPFMMVFLYYVKRIVPHLGDIWISVFLLLIAITDYFFWIFRIQIISNNQLGPFQLKYILLGCAAGYLCKSMRVKNWMSKSRPQLAFDILCVLCVLLILFCTPLLAFVSPLGQTFSTEMLAVSEWLIIVLILFLIIGSYFSVQGIYHKIMCCKPIAYIGMLSFTILLVHIPLSHIPFYSGTLHNVFVILTSLVSAIIFKKGVEEPATRLTKFICSEINAHKYISIIAFFIVMLYAAMSFFAAHSKEYLLGKTLGLAADDVLGFKYASGFAYATMEGTWVESDSVEFEFMLSAVPEKDLMLTLDVLEVNNFSQIMAVEVNGIHVKTVELTNQDVAIIRIPHGILEDRAVNIECCFSEGSSSPARFRSVKLSEVSYYVIGTELSFLQEEQTANSYFSYGLKSAEQTATWAKESARLDIPIDIRGTYNLSLKLNWAAIDSHAQQMIVSCGDLILLDHTFFYENQTIINIPNECIKNDILTLRFSFPDACPCSFAFTSMKFENRQVYTLGTELSFSAIHATANSYFTYGLAVAEETATWAKDVAQASFLLSDSSPKDVAITVSWLAVDSQAQRLIISCCGKELWNQSYLTEGKATITIPHKYFASGILTIDFAFPDACPSSFAFSTITISAA